MDADMLNSFENGDFYCLDVILNTEEKTAIWYTQTEKELHSNSCNSTGQDDDYEGALEMVICETLAEIELNESSHSNSIDDDIYESKSDFFLEAVKSNTYQEYMKNYIFEEFGIEITEDQFIKYSNKVEEIIIHEIKKITTS